MVCATLIISNPDHVERPREKKQRVKQGEHKGTKRVRHREGLEGLNRSAGDILVFLRETIFL